MPVHHLFLWKNLQKRTGKQKNGKAKTGIESLSTGIIETVVPVPHREGELYGVIRIVGSPGLMELSL